MDAMQNGMAGETIAAQRHAQQSTRRICTSKGTPAVANIERSPGGAGGHTLAVNQAGKYRRDSAGEGDVAGDEGGDEDGVEQAEGFVAPSGLTQRLWEVRAQLKLGIFLMVLQQLVGINTIMYCAPRRLELATLRSTAAPLHATPLRLFTVRCSSGAPVAFRRI